MTAEHPTIARGLNWEVAMFARVLLAGSAVLAGTAAHAQLADGSFETQGATVTSDCRFAGPAGAFTPCPAGAWSGGLGTGIQNETNTAWPGLPTPDGSKYGFVQSQGVLTQTFTANQSGTFELTWLNAGRPNNLFAGIGGDQSYDVLLNNLLLGTFSTTSGEPFTAQTSSPFDLVSGQTYTLSFNGRSTSDNTAYIDAVGLVAPVPEPATWAMMLLGFGAIGAAMRRRKIQTTFA
jgi:hypothetical protein